MSTQHQSIDEDVPMTPPTDSIAADLEEQYEWLLRRFTSAGWTVTELQVETNSHTDCSETVLEAVLSHDSGSVLQIVPFDPLEHQHDVLRYRTNRVRLRDNIADRNCYVTLEPEIGEWPTDAYPADEFVAQQRHPFPKADDKIAFHEQATVHAEDKAVLESGEDARRSYSMTTLKQTLLTVFGAAQSVTRAEAEQADLGSYF
jgi:hypothetical protein